MKKRKYTGEAKTDLEILAGLNLDIMANYKENAEIADVAACAYYLYSDSNATREAAARLFPSILVRSSFPIDLNLLNEIIYTFCKIRSIDSPEEWAIEEFIEEFEGSWEK